MQISDELKTRDGTLECAVLRENPSKRKEKELAFLPHLLACEG